MENIKAKSEEDLGRLIGEKQALEAELQQELARVQEDLD